MKSLTSKTFPYRKCKKVYQKMLEWGLEEISRYDLRKLISTYCAATPKMIDLYKKRFVDFGFLIRHPTKINMYQVSQKLFFSPNKKSEPKIFHQNTIKKEQLQHNLNIKTANSCYSNKDVDEINVQSKTLVYPNGKGPRVNFSIKVKQGLRSRYVDRVKELGLDCCYVQEAWMNAFMVATDEANNLIHVPFQIGLSVLNVNLIVPYVVSKPRRLRKHVEVIDEEVDWAFMLDSKFWYARQV